MLHGESRVFGTVHDEGGAGDLTKARADIVAGQ